ncbi:hypothetical protein [Chromohalobacter sp. 296-RDG]|uniref:hypothetical protein n=1 Tax=Chromohalobacter sp. 296-RDG TaxID=2994062 RepID=UPI0024682B9B|nr:hypothetical protein [Chromohalobacter sp. 296-RDG]
MSTSPDIQSLSVWLDKPAVQQAFTSLAAPILQAKTTAQVSGEQRAADLFGDGKHYPASGEAVIGRMKGLVVKMIIEPDSSGWTGEHLTHHDINAIGISDMLVDGEWIKNKEQ